MHPLYEEAINHLKKACEILGLSQDEFELLKQPDRIIEVKIPVKMDDGTIKTFIGWRSQHNNALGPYKGGIRYHPETTREEVIALSMIMTWKNSLAGLPYGGGKGGIRVDPRKLSQRELEQLSRGFFHAISRYVGPDIDVPAPDVYTNPQVMAWFFDEYSKARQGEQFFGVVTGKPKLLGGLETRIESTGFGTALTARLAAEKLYGSIENRTVAIQGFGNVGQYAAKYLEQWGARIVAVSDSSGGIFHGTGFEVKGLLHTKNTMKKIVLHEDKDKTISNEELLELDVDILIPAALENVINESNMKKIKARIIVEGANGPVTKIAEEYLQKEKGVVIVPDILANAGGVITSHIEWVNNRMGMWIKEEEAKKRLEEKMTTVFEEAWSFWENIGKEYTFRNAAYTLGVRRVVEALKLRGIL